MQITLTSEEARLLRHHLAARISHLDNELVRTDKRELQRDLARDLAALRAVAKKVDGEDTDA